MTVFEAVKAISCNDAAERLGIRGKRTSAGQGRWVCPFHDDHTPSMVCYDSTNRYYCFTCHATGDAANLYQRVMGLSPLAAAKEALAAFGLRIPEGCDRPQGQGEILRQEMVNKACRAVRREYKRGMMLFLSGRMAGMCNTMEQDPDTQGWIWNHALQHACKTQEEFSQWDGMEDADLAEEIRENLAANRLPVWGEGTPAPGMDLFLEIMDDLTRRDEHFPRLSPAETQAALKELCRVPPPSQMI